MWLLTKTEIHTNCHLQALRLSLPAAAAPYASKLATVHRHHSSSGASTTWRWQLAINKDKHHSEILRFYLSMALMLRQRFISVYRSHSDESGACTADDGKVEILWESVLSLRNLHLVSINPKGFIWMGGFILVFVKFHPYGPKHFCRMSENS